MQRFRPTFILTFFLVFYVPTGASADFSMEAVERPPLMLGQGEQRLLPVKDLRRFSLGGSAVKAVRVPAEMGGSGLLLKAVALGSADLWVWKTDGTIESRVVHVREWAAPSLSPQLHHLLGALREAEVIAAPSGVALRGRIASLPEATRIGGIRRTFSQEVTDETELSEELLDQGEKVLHHWLDGTPNSSAIQLQRVGGRLLARGSVANPSDRKLIEAKLARIFPPVQVELQSLSNAASTIFFRVFLLELRKDRFRSFGLQWPGTIENALHVTTQAIRDALALDLAIHAMSQEGSAKILSKPEIAVRAPGEAELFAGGELPIRNQGKFFSNTSWKSFGLTLKLRVLEATGTEVRLEIQTEVSHMDTSIASDQVPGFRANRMRTQVDAQFGTPLLLSGLLQENVRKQARGLPGLREIPILGALFGSEDFLKEKSELVAILLPQHLPPAAPLARLGEELPRGRMPPPRNWVSDSDLRQLQNAADYPWNVFGD